MRRATTTNTSRTAPSTGRNAPSTGRAGSSARSSSGGPTVPSYSARAQQFIKPGVQQPSSSSRGTTPVPNRGGPPQPTPRNASQPRGQQTPGLVNTPRPGQGNTSAASSAARTSPRRGGPSYNSDSDNYAPAANKKQQQQHPAFEGTGADNYLFSRKLPHLPEFQTADARDALRSTIENEKALQGLVKSRRDRQLELFEMMRDEGDQWQARLEHTNKQLQTEEKKRLDLAAQARQIETEALNMRHKLRQVQQQAKKQGLDASGGSSSNNGEDAPHRIISSVLTKFNNVGDDADSSSGDDDAEYAAILARDDPELRLELEMQEEQHSASRSGSWFSRGGAGGEKKKRKLTKAERLLACNKIANQLDQSVRVTRLSVESRMAELEASVGEISSLQNQRIGFGVSLDEMRQRVKKVHDAVKQAAWMESCLPLLEQTVKQREALAEQGEDYGRKVLDNLMQLNKRDDETIALLQERSERNLLSTDQLIRMAQEENAHMNKELSEAVREAETWRASMRQTSERYERQLGETEAAINDASRARRQSLF